MNKPIEVINVRKVCCPKTFQPKIECLITFNMEVIQGGKYPTKGLSPDTYREEFLDYLFKEIQAGIDDYESIVKTYNLVFADEIYEDKNPHMNEKPIFINRNWISIGITNTPTFRTFSGESKENKTYKTSIIIPRSELDESLLNSNFQQYFTKGLQECIVEEGMKYYYAALLLYQQADDSYTLMIRGTK